MPVIAIVNRKGGSGKSTLATHIAAWLAHQGASVLLGDIDRQQSVLSWLKRRDPDLPAITPWTVDRGHILKKPPSITHVILDTPGGIHGFELAKVVMTADAVVIPVCNSLFDRESACRGHAELLSLPRVSSGRCALGVVGMRIDSRVQSTQTLRDWAGAQGMNFLGELGDAPMYVSGLENGRTLFDLPKDIHTTDLLKDWKPLLQWLRPIARLPGRAAPVISLVHSRRATTNSAFGPLVSTPSPPSS